MKPLFETYVKGKGTASATFELVIHGEGAGKFNIRQVVIDKAKGPVYSVISSPASLVRFQEFLESIPKQLEEIFDIGAVGIGYHEGEVTVQFPESFSENFTDQDLANISGFATTGITGLAERYAEYQDEMEEATSRKPYPAILGMLIVVMISLLSIIYGERIVPIEWLRFGSMLLAGHIFLGLVMVALIPALREVNKIIIFCLCGANAILVMLLIGFFSLVVYPDRIVRQEGSIDYLFSGGRMEHLMRIRLVEDRNKSYLVPKYLLKRQPDYLPRAAIFEMRKGFFGTRYIESVGLF